MQCGVNKLILKLYTAWCWYKLVCVHLFLDLKLRHFPFSVSIAMTPCLNVKNAKHGVWLERSWINIYTKYVKSVLMFTGY